MEVIYTEEWKSEKRKRGRRERRGEKMKRGERKEF